MGISGWFGYWLFFHLPFTIALSMKVLLITGVITIIYCILLLLFGLLQKDEMIRIPWIGRALSKLALR